MDVTVDLFVSVDGWARGTDSPGFFGYYGPELGAWIDAELAQPEVLLFGRRTYDALSELSAADAAWIGDKEKVVFTRTLTSVTWPKTGVSDDLVAEVGRRKAEDGGLPLRTMGSLSVVRQLLGAGLVDRLRMMTFPLLVGPTGDEAALADVVSADLELADHRVFDGRVVLLEYRPTGKDIPRG